MLVLLPTVTNKLMEGSCYVKAKVTAVAYEIDMSDNHVNMLKGWNTPTVCPAVEEMENGEEIPLWRNLRNRRSTNN